MKQTVLETVNALGRFATVAQVRAAGHTDSEILAADEARDVCLKKACASNRPAKDGISDGFHTFHFVVA